MTPLEKLQRRWRVATGTQMPADIAALPIDRIKVAVKLTEAGMTVFVPADRAMSQTIGVDVGDSMMDWDSHKG